MSDNYESRAERVRRETYADVRREDYDLYSDIVAFASSLDLEQDHLRVRALVEGFCMDAVRRALR